MKFLRYTLIILVILGALFAAAYFIKTNKKGTIEYETQTAITTTIERKTVATGKVIPEDEVEIKPQISGIIEKIFVEEGEKVNVGTLIAKVKVVPNEQALNSAKGRVANAEIVERNAKINYNRNRDLYKKEVIAKQDFENAQVAYRQAKQETNNAKSDLRIIKLGSAGGSSTANTNIRATIAGTILEIPVKEGDQVIESNTFNAGTTIATIANLNKMIFEGKVDESEVSKLNVGSPLKVNLGAMQDQHFDAKLRFIAPKGNEDQGTVKFKIEADVTLSGNFTVRAGYSANASITLEKKENILAIPEALLQFDVETQEPYVEIEVEAQKFERKDVKIGISDGINAELISGISKDDKIKVWNQTQPIKKTN